MVWFGGCLECVNAAQDDIHDIHQEKLSFLINYAFNLIGTSEVSYYFYSVFEGCTGVVSCVCKGE